KGGKDRNRSRAHPQNSMFHPLTSSWTSTRGPSIRPEFRAARHFLRHQETCFHVCPPSSLRQNERSKPTAYAILDCFCAQATGPNITFELSARCHVLPPSVERSMPTLVISTS